VKPVKFVFRKLVGLDIAKWGFVYLSFGKVLVEGSERGFGSLECWKVCAKGIKMMFWLP
jgi:hypothetical protein